MATASAAGTALSACAFPSVSGELTMVGLSNSLQPQPSKPVRCMFRGPFIAYYGSSSQALGFVVLSETSTVQALDGAPTSFRITARNGMFDFNAGTEAAANKWMVAIDGVLHILQGDFSLPAPPSQPRQAPVIRRRTHDSFQLTWAAVPVRHLKEAIKGYVLQLMQVPGPSGPSFQGRPSVGSVTEASDMRGAAVEDPEDWSTATEVNVGTSLDVTVDGLTPQTWYRFRFAANNAVGLGPFSVPTDDVVTLGPPSVAPPQPVAKEPRLDGFTLEWEVPEDGMGPDDAPTTGFTIHCLDGHSSSALREVRIEQVSVRRAEITGLPTDSFLSARIRVDTAAGSSEWSPVSEGIFTLGPLTVPMNPPRFVDDSSTVDSVSLCWDAAELGPTDAPVLHYELAYRVTPDPMLVGDVSASANLPFSEFVAVGDAITRAFEVKGLQHSSFYSFVIRGVNGCGPGPASEPSPPIRTLGAPTVPPARPDVSSATSSSVHVEWRENELGPFDSEINQFMLCWRVVAEDGTPVAGDEDDVGATSGSATLPFVLQHTAEGLRHSSWLQFSIRAGNDCGMGPQGDWSRPIRTKGAPTRTPAAPTCSDATVHSLAVAWEDVPLGEHDSVVTSYVVVYQPSDGDASSVGAGEVAVGLCNSHTLTGLAADVLYHVAVRAVNEVGTGPLGEWSSAVWTQGPPTIAMAQPQPGVVDIGGVAVSWHHTELGEHDAPITGYVVGWCQDGHAVDAGPAGVTPSARAGGSASQQPPPTPTAAGAGAGAGGPTADAVGGDAGSVGAPAAAGGGGGGTAPALAGVTLGGTEVHVGMCDKYVVTGLSPDRQYRFYVRAVNDAGLGPVGELCAPVWTLGPPTVRMPPPECQDATVSSIAVSWNDVELGPHDAPISGYVVTWQVVTKWDKAPPDAQDSGSIELGLMLNHTVKGLIPESVYTFAVHAVNPVGRGPSGTSSAPVHTLGHPTRVPEPPVCLSASVRSAEIGWTETAPQGFDAPITGYTLLWKHVATDADAEGSESKATGSGEGAGSGSGSSSSGVDDYNHSMQVKSGAFQQTVTGLSHSSTYVFAVQTFNVVGCSPVSPPSAPVHTQYRPNTAPSAPALTARFSRRLELAWDEPDMSDARVAPITGYKVVWRRAGGAAPIGSLQTSSAAPAIVIPRLAPGQSYEFSVCAINACGTGPESELSDPLSTIDKPNAAPSQPVVTPGPMTYGTSVGSLMVKWTMPDGPDPVQSYLVSQQRMKNGEADGPPEECATPSAECKFVVQNLPFHHQFRFQVAAVNETGVGPYSAVSDTVAVSPPPSHAVAPPPPPAASQPPVAAYDASVMSSTGTGGGGGGGGDGGASSSVHGAGSVAGSDGLPPPPGSVVSPGVASPVSAPVLEPVPDASAAEWQPTGTGGGAAAATAAPGPAAAAGPQPMPAAAPAPAAATDAVPPLPVASVDAGGGSRRQCHVCNKVLKRRTAFCTGCGAKQEAAPPAPAPTAMATAMPPPPGSAAVPVKPSAGAAGSNGGGSGAGGVPPCANCDKPLRPGTRFCTSCGTPNPNLVQVCECGHPFGPKVKFCVKCGLKRPAVAS